MRLYGDRWIQVRIPLEDLKGENERMAFLELSGEVVGTFYIDDVKLVAAKLPEPTAVETSQEADLPSYYALSQNYPNPFNPQTAISYAVAQPGTVQLHIYAITGQHIRTLMDGEHAAGPHSVTWDGRDADGQDVASGVYVCRMEAGAFSAVRKLVLVR